MKIRPKTARMEQYNGYPFLPSLFFHILFLWMLFGLLTPTIHGHNDTAISCTRGKYRGFKGSQRECTLCPRGTYGDVSGLTSSTCTGQCPVGTYNDVLGARTIDDCRLCPQGKYGSLPGLTTKECSGSCPPGKYSDAVGITSITSCVRCPRGFYMWQCNEGERQYTGKAVPPRAHKPNTGSLG